MKAKYYVEYIALRCLRTFLLMMTVDLASWFMGQIWQIFGPFNQRHKRALRHMNWALDDTLSLSGRRQLARMMWDNLGRTFAETLIFDRLMKKTDRFTVNEDGYLLAKAACQNGGIFVTHHYGNWEFAGHAMNTRKSSNILGVYKKMKNPLVEAFLKRLRLPAYNGGLFTKQDQPTRQIISHIHQGGEVAMVADFRDINGVAIRYFDMPMWVTTFPAKLAIQLDKPLFAAQLRRTKGAYFNLDLIKLGVDQFSNDETKITELTQAVHQQFEHWVQQEPGQLMWASYRWSGRYEPEQQPLSWALYYHTSP